MGLDINLRLRRINSRPVDEDDWGNEIYLDKDIEDIGEAFNGRNEFAVIREWVTDPRYGHYVPLTGLGYIKLVQMIEDEFSRRVANNNEEDEAPLWLRDSWGLGKLYSLILLAPTYEKYGWYLELECDW